MIIFTHQDKLLTDEMALPRCCMIYSRLFKESLQINVYGYSVLWEFVVGMNTLEERVDKEYYFSWQ